MSLQDDVALATERLNVAVSQLSEDSRLAYMARNPNEAKLAATAIENGLGQLDERLKTFLATVPETERERSDRIRKLIGDFVATRSETARLALEVSGRAADAWGNSAASRRNRTELLEELSGFSRMNEEAGEAFQAEAAAFTGKMNVLDQILSHSKKVAATIADISAAAGEQANGIDEMSQAVAHLDEMTQANAALSEQSAASAASLSTRIGQLNDLVAAFRTGQDA